MPIEGHSPAVGTDAKLTMAKLPNIFSSSFDLGSGVRLEIETNGEKLRLFWKPDNTYLYSNYELGFVNF